MESEYSSKNLDHLGIVAGVCEELGLKDLVNNLIGTDVREKFSTGEILTLMAINGLGFTSKPLYLTSHFYSSKPLEKLLSRDLEEEEISDDKLGRTLDKIYKYGAEKLFSAIGIAAATKFGIEKKWLHLDTTSMSVHGEYSTSENKECEEAKIIEFGHSKDHRSDLKQFMISLICTQDGGIPLLEQTLKGNTSDSTYFREILKSLQTEAEKSEEPKYYVVDAAMYNEETLKVLGTKTKWLSRVPVRLKEAKDLVFKTREEELEDLKNGYKGKEYVSEYGGVEQRWFLIYSEQAYNREIKTFDKKLLKTDADKAKELKRLSKIKFNCKKDAEEELKRFEKKLEYHKIEKQKILEKKCYHKSGKPKEGDAFDLIFLIDATIKRDESEIKKALNKKGKFILATNISKTDNPELEIIDFLNNYKQQQKVERGFRFIKSNEFLADAVFLKKQSRIIALSMVMCLCLMIYSLAERNLRLKMKEQEKTLPNQLGKEVKNPTMRWIFQLFEGISVLYKKRKGDCSTMILNLKHIHSRILDIFGVYIAKFYST